MTAEENVARVREGDAAYTLGATATLRDPQIAALRGCQSRTQALQFAGITDAEPSGSTP